MESTIEGLCSMGVVENEPGDLIRKTIIDQKIECDNGRLSKRGDDGLFR